MNEKFYIETPCVESDLLAGIGKVAKVYMKLDNLQPSGSFKLRGISCLVKHELQKGKKRLVCSSGGNAGMAASYVANKLHIPITVYIPTTTKPWVVRQLENLRAKVVVVGDAWNEADLECRKALVDNQVAYIPPFDHPYLWEGNATLIEESARQLPTKPDVVVLSVGGGGLLMGVVQGMDKVGWQDVPIMAMETEGTSSLHQSISAGKLVTLSKIEGFGFACVLLYKDFRPQLGRIATSLGASRVAELAFEESKKRPIISYVVTDRDCVEAMSLFLDGHRMLVEPSCAATICSISKNIIPAHMRTVLLIICGGSVINQDIYHEFKTRFDL